MRVSQIWLKNYNLLVQNVPAMIIIQIVNTRSLSVSAATLPNPTLELEFIFHVKIALNTEKIRIHKSTSEKTTNANHWQKVVSKRIYLLRKAKEMTFIRYIAGFFDCQSLNVFFLLHKYRLDSIEFFSPFDFHKQFIDFVIHTDYIVVIRCTSGQ